jgi:hypothetical protein
MAGWLCRESTTCRRSAGRRWGSEPAEAGAEEDGWASFMGRKAGPGSLLRGAGRFSETGDAAPAAAVRLGGCVGSRPWRSSGNDGASTKLGPSARPWQIAPSRAGVAVVIQLEHPRCSGRSARREPRPGARWLRRVRPDSTNTVAMLLRYRSRSGCSSTASLSSAASLNMP